MTVQDRVFGARTSHVLAVLFVGVLMAALDIAIVGPALPAIGRDFGVDARDLAWVFTIYVLFNLIGTPITAKASDLYGRRTIYALNVGLFALGSVVVAAAPNFAALLIGRAVQGLGAGGIFPVAAAVVGDVFPPERRGGALGMLGAVFGLAFLIGPILGGLLLPFGWSWLFLINLPLAAVVIAAALRVLPDRRRADRFRIDGAGTLLLSLGLAGLALGLNALDTDDIAAGLRSAQVWPLLIAAVVFLAWFWRAEQRAAEPIVPPRLLRNRQLLVSDALAWVAGAIEAGLVFVPSMVVAAFGVPPATASFLLLPAVLAMALGSPLIGRLLDRLGSKIVLVMGSALLAAALAGVPWYTRDLPLFMAGGAAIGLALASLVGAPLRYVVINETGPAERGAAQAVTTIFRSVGRMTAGALLGALIASQGGGLAGYHLAFGVLAAVTAAGALLALGLKNRDAERETV